MIERRPLGRSGIHVSALGLGTVKLGRSAGVKYPTAVRIPSDDEVRELLLEARSLGVNLIDTAPAYGSSEERLGMLLPTPRDDWAIVTKVGESFDGERSTFDFSPEAIRASVERSLLCLRTDRVECVLVHSDGAIEARLVESGVLDALVELRSRGLARSIGVSTKTPEGAALAIAHTDVVMLTLSPARREELPMIARAHAAGVGVLVKKALDSGHASDPREGVRFAASTRGVSSVVVGTTSIAHLRELAEAAGHAADGT
ncbi:MAG: aldo/keto reductase [Phycisphaerales bacterium]|jgi:aryl-alcohol dehydrogenase-like predicted oxidoreductase|nr:aldo/keto reductase [Phycisphaerales bacterium]